MVTCFPQCYVIAATIARRTLHVPAPSTLRETLLRDGWVVLEEYHPIAAQVVGWVVAHRAACLVLDATQHRPVHAPVSVGVVAHCSKSGVIAATVIRRALLVGTSHCLLREALHWDVGVLLGVQDARAARVAGRVEADGAACIIFLSTQHFIVHAPVCVGMVAHVPKCQIIAAPVTRRALFVAASGDLIDWLLWAGTWVVGGIDGVQESTAAMEVGRVVAFVATRVLP